MALKKTLKLFSEVLEEVFDEAPVTKDINEEIKRPCTYITPTSIDVEPMQGLIEEKIGLTITRFATENYKGYLELLTTQEILAKLLTSPVMVQRFACYPDDISFEISREDEVLECSFSVTVVGEPTAAEEEAETAEQLMQVLKAKLNESEMTVE